MHDPLALRSVGAIVEPDGKTRFRVWAPRAPRIELRLLAPTPELAPLQPVGAGYFETLIAAPVGTRYLYRISAGVERPDPASRFQPLGIHQASQVTASEFDWTDTGWRGLPWRDYVIYETHVGAFTPAGTFEALIPQLDELVRLGVTAIELMPLAQFPGGRNWGYDGVHPYAPQNTYGGPEALKRLVDACHTRGLAVVLDVVYNHLGPEGNYLHEFGPYFSDRYRTPWGPAINFDGPDSDPVRAFFLGNAVYWLREFHIDALRLDATHAIFDQSPRHFLRELADVVHATGEQLGRSVYAIAESNACDPRVVRPATQGGYGIDAQIVDDFQRSLHALVTGESAGYYADFGRVDHFAKACAAGFVLTGQYSKYRRRQWGAAAHELPADKFVVCAQNHDSVGNRPGGERLGRLVDFESLKLVAVATLLSPSIPFLFMGEEYNEPAPFHFFTSYLDAGLARNVREGRLREFAGCHWTSDPPDPQAEETFARSRLTGQLARAEHGATLWSFYQELLRLRKQFPAIRQPAREHSQVTTLGKTTLLVFREEKDDRVCIALHFGTQDFDLAPHLPSDRLWRIVFDSAGERWGGQRPARLGEVVPGQPMLMLPRSAIVLL